MNEPGVQPERDGQLLCLECGVWRRGLGSHIRQHSMTAEQYKQAHGLPMSRALIPGDLSVIHSARARRVFGVDQELREKFAASSSGKVGLEAANRKRRQTEGRAGVKAKRKRVTGNEQWRRSVQAKRDAAWQGHEDTARRHGYQDLAALLDEMKTVQVAALLGVSSRTVQRLRLIRDDLR